jgi:hypothetical protein
LCIQLSISANASNAGRSPRLISPSEIPTRLGARREFSACLAFLAAEHIQSAVDAGQIKALPIRGCRHVEYLIGHGVETHA